MFAIEVRDINELLYEVCNHTMQYGEKVTVKKQETKELHPFHVTVEEPMKRTLLYPYRGNNPFSTLFELIWVLGAKDNSIEYLSKYLKRAPKYSDDGKRWRAGYPERIRKFRNTDLENGVTPEIGVDQFKYVYEKLTADPESRQAVINLWNPKRDCFRYNNVGEYGYKLKESKDFPCSQNLTFLIRNGKLDCTFYIRSNDAIFGCTSINLYEFTVMQEILAGMLGVEIGKFYYYINSLHIYSLHYDKAKKIIDEGKRFSDYLGSPCEYDGTNENFVTRYNIPVFKFFVKEMADYDDQMAMYEHLYYEITERPGIGDGSRPDNINDIYNLLTIYQTYKDKEFSLDVWVDYCKDMMKVSLSDLKCACHFWMAKNFGCIENNGIDVSIQQMLLMEKERQNETC